MEGGIELLKKGFAALEKHVRKRKTALEDRLQREERLDAADNAWLDGPANMIDERRALDVLEDASDYERGLSGLSQGLQVAVQRMKDFAASKMVRLPGPKRKSVSSKCFHCTAY
jgi:hypothetical protein